MVTSLAGEWAPALCRSAPGLTESEALELVWRLFGYDDLDLPATTAALQPDQLPLTTIFAREVAKLKSAADPALGLYPPISAGAAPHIVKAFCTALAENRCDGAMLSFGATEDTVEKVLRMRIGKWLERR